MATELQGELLINLKTAFGSTVALPVTGSLGTTPVTTGITDTTVRQPAQTVNTILKASNPNRVGLVIYNNSTANMFVKLGATADIGAGTESYTRKLPPAGYFEIPFFYTGRVDAIWDAADATGEALLFERFTGISPLSITGCLDWHEADQGVTNPGGAVSAWTDHSGANHNLDQTTGANQPSQVAAIINGMPVVRFGPPPGTDAFMNWTPNWAGPNISTVLAVIRMRTTASYQAFMFRNAEASLYLGTTAGDGFANRPTVYTNAPTAQWTADLVDTTSYLIKWGADGATETCYTQVNNAAEVSAVSGLAFDGGIMMTIGLDPLISAAQDLISDLALLAIYDHILTAGELTTFWSYVNSRYAIF
jgi:hypothetical protein